MNLVLKFKLAGDGSYQLRGASRITVDGQGGFTLFDPDSGAAEKIDLAQLQLISIQPVADARKAA